MKELFGSEKNRGVTLIELIVVIAIMGTLTGILTPMFMKYINKSRKAKDVYTADNIEKKDKRQFHFITDPLEIYELECKAEKDGYKVVGFFHSHPDCEAVLSVEDEKYMIPKMLYLIVSVRDGIYRDVKGYIKASPDERASYVEIKAR